jgi:hypothetical protein
MNYLRLSQRTLTLVSLLSLSTAGLHAAAIAYMSVDGGLQSFTAGATSGTQRISNGNGINVTGLALDGSGNVYFTNFQSNIVVGEMTPEGTVTDYSTTNQPLKYGGYEGLAFDAQGNLFTAGIYNTDVVEINTSGVASVYYGPYYGVNNPMGVAFDSNGVFFMGDATGPNYSSSIDEFSNTGAYSIKTGLFPCCVYGDPGTFGLAIDSSNNIYVSDPITNFILKVTPTGSVSTFASGLGSVRGLAFDSAGDLFAIDNQYFNSGNNQILEFAAGSNTPTVFATFTGDAGQYLAIEGSYSPTPEPGTWTLFGLAGGCFLAARWKRTRQ